MIIPLANKSGTQLATGKLIHGNIKKDFHYETLKDSRRYSYEDPVVGLTFVKASLSIKTNDNHKFVNGDRVLLEEMNQPLRVMRVTPDVDEKQYMYLKRANKVSYILDLE